jgi:excisionase family DNA binding protein
MSVVVDRVILTMKEAAFLLRIGGSTRYRPAAQGVLPVAKVAGRKVLRIRRPALSQLIQDRKGWRARRGRP